MSKSVPLITRAAATGTTKNTAIARSAGATNSQPACVDAADASGLAVRGARAPRDRGVLRRAGGGSSRDERHRLRHLRAGGPAQRALHLARQLRPAAPEAAVLAGAAQYALLRGGRRAAVRCRLAGGGAPVELAPVALQGPLSHRALRAGGDH